MQHKKLITLNEKLNFIAEHLTFDEIAKFTDFKDDPEQINLILKYLPTRDKRENKADSKSSSTSKTKESKSTKSDKENEAEYNMLCHAANVDTHTTQTRGLEKAAIVMEKYRAELEKEKKAAEQEAIASFTEQYKQAFFPTHPTDEEKATFEQFLSICESLQIKITRKTSDNIPYIVNQTKEKLAEEVHQEGGLTERAQENALRLFADLVNGTQRPTKSQIDNYVHYLSVTEQDDLFLKSSIKLSEDEKQQVPQTFQAFMNACAEYPDIKLADSKPSFEKMCYITSFALAYARNNAAELENNPKSGLEFFAFLVNNEHSLEVHHARVAHIADKTPVPFAENKERNKKLFKRIHDDVFKKRASTGKLEDETKDTQRPLKDLFNNRAHELGLRISVKAASDLEEECNKFLMMHNDLIATDSLFSTSDLKKQLEDVLTVARSLFQFRLIDKLSDHARGANHLDDKNDIMTKILLASAISTPDLAVHAAQTKIDNALAKEIDQATDQALEKFELKKSKATLVALQAAESKYKKASIDLVEKLNAYTSKLSAFNSKIEETKHLERTNAANVAELVKKLTELKTEFDILGAEDSLSEINNLHAKLDNFSNAPTLSISTFQRIQYGINKTLREIQNTKENTISTNNSKIEELTAEYQTKIEALKKEIKDSKRPSNMEECQRQLDDFKERAEIIDSELAEMLSQLSTTYTYSSHSLPDPHAHENAISNFEQMLSTTSSTLTAQEEIINSVSSKIPFLDARLKTLREKADENRRAAEVTAEEAARLLQQSKAEERVKEMQRQIAVAQGGHTDESKTVTAEELTGGKTLQDEFEELATEAATEKSREQVEAAQRAADEAAKLVEAMKKQLQQSEDEAAKKLAEEKAKHDEDLRLLNENILAKQKEAQAQLDLLAQQKTVAENKAKELADTLSAETAKVRTFAEQLEAERRRAEEQAEEAKKAIAYAEHQAEVQRQETLKKAEQDKQAAIDAANKTQADQLEQLKSAQNEAARRLQEQITSLSAAKSAADAALESSQSSSAEAINEAQEKAKTAQEAIQKARAEAEAQAAQSKEAIARHQEEAQKRLKEAAEKADLDRTMLLAAAGKAHQEEMTKLHNKHKEIARTFEEKNKALAEEFAIAKQKAAQLQEESTLQQKILKEQAQKREADLQAARAQLSAAQEQSKRTLQEAHDAILRAQQEAADKIRAEQARNASKVHELEDQQKHREIEHKSAQERLTKEIEEIRKRAADELKRAVEDKQKAIAEVKRMKQNESKEKEQYLSFGSHLTERAQAVHSKSVSIFSKQQHLRESFMDLIPVLQKIQQEGLRKRKEAEDARNNSIFGGFFSSTTLPDIDTEDYDKTRNKVFSHLNNNVSKNLSLTDADIIGKIEESLLDLNKKNIQVDDIANSIKDYYVNKDQRSALEQLIKNLDTFLFDKITLINSCKFLINDFEHLLLGDEKGKESRFTSPRKTPVKSGSTATASTESKTESTADFFKRIHNELNKLEKLRNEKDITHGLHQLLAQIKARMPALNIQFQINKDCTISLATEYAIEKTRLDLLFLISENLRIFQALKEVADSNGNERLQKRINILNGYAASLLVADLTLGVDENEQAKNEALIDHVNNKLPKHIEEWSREEVSYKPAVTFKPEDIAPDKTRAEIETELKQHPASKHLRTVPEILTTVTDEKGQQNTSFKSAFQIAVDHAYSQQQKTSAQRKLNRDAHAKHQQLHIKAHQQLVFFQKFVSKPVTVKRLSPQEPSQQAKRP